MPLGSGKLLEDASIKVSAVASSVTTVSAREMLAALVAGDRDPRAMAELAKGKMRRKIPDLTEALTGQSCSAVVSRRDSYLVARSKDPTRDHHRGDHC
jgi:hypothetical protein